MSAFRAVLHRDLLLALRLAHAIDQRHKAHESDVARLLTPIAKFWICYW